MRKQSKKNGEIAGIHIQGLLTDIVDFHENKDSFDNKMKSIVADIVWDTQVELTGTKNLEKQMKKFCNKY